MEKRLLERKMAEAEAIVYCTALAVLTALGAVCYVVTSDGWHLLLFTGCLIAFLIVLARR